MARILLVDDDPALLDGLSEALARRLPGCDIVTADCGETVLSVLRSNRIDLVISDLLMAGLGSTRLVEALEQLGRAVPTIIMTGTIETPREKLPAGAIGGHSQAVQPVLRAEVEAAWYIPLSVKYRPTLSPLPDTWHIAVGGIIAIDRLFAGNHGSSHAAKGHSSATSR